MRKNVPQIRDRNQSAKRPTTIGIGLGLSSCGSIRPLVLARLLDMYFTTFTTGGVQVSFPLVVISCYEFHHTKSLAVSTLRIGGPVLPRSNLPPQTQRTSLAVRRYLTCHTRTSLPQPDLAFTRSVGALKDLRPYPARRPGQDSA